MESKVKVLWRKYKRYSGPMIRGTTTFLPPNGARKNHHVDRAFWLTTAVETGAKFGAVMAYDGTGMTAGLDQHVAVYPRELSKPDDGNALDDQGTLWKLLRRIETVRGGGLFREDLSQLWENLAKAGWYLAQDGVLRMLTDGSPVEGNRIRDQFTPIGGNPNTPLRKDEAKHWALLFHYVFASSATFRAQVEYGKEHLVKRTKRRHLKMKGGLVPNISAMVPVASLYPVELTRLCVGDATIPWTEEQDLAMCVYQAHSVNAPAIANKILMRSIGPKQYGADPGKLIRLLGNSKYGRWDDDIKHGRYQRTRSAARASGLWPKDLFDGKGAIMPKDLLG